MNTQLKDLIKKAFAFLSIKITLLNKKNEFYQLGLNNNNSEIFKKGKKIILKDFGLSINYDKHYYILKGLGYMYNLKTLHRAEFEIDTNDVFIIKINHLTYNIQTFEELFILNEIFVSGIYNISTNKKFSVIDIGMNVALTSLYFAQNPNCLSIYSFEPFKLTFEQAMLNLELNPEIKDKIRAFNFGLGKDNKALTVTYDKEIKGNMGINGIPEYLIHQNQGVENEEINIRDASEILYPIINALKSYDQDVVLKIDCEGSEYDIFDSFGKSKILHHFNVVLIEWHFKGPEQICSYLKEEGFTFLSLNPNDKNSGSIYAVNKKIPIKYT